MSVSKGIQGATLYDAAVNALASVQDGADYLLGVAAKVRNVAGTIINPATEDKQDDAIAKLTSLDGKDYATQTTLATRAAEATLQTADGRLATIDAVLDSIKDADGVKKITDQLPAGTNEIGKVAQGTRAAAAAGWPEYLVDASGNVVGVVLDGAVYRLQTDSKVAQGASDLVTLEALDVSTGIGRLKATLYSPGGDPVAFPAVSADIKNEFAENAGSSSLLVDGSGTPVVFSYDADATYDISIQEIHFTIVDNALTFGSGYFGGIAGPLTNGMLVQADLASGTTDIYNIVDNESFVNFASPGGFQWVPSNRDLMSCGYTVGGGLILRGGSSDKIKVTVRDDIDAAANYMRCFIKGNLLGV